MQRSNLFYHDTRASMSISQQIIFYLRLSGYCTSTFWNLLDWSDLNLVCEENQEVNHSTRLQTHSPSSNHDRVTENDYIVCHSVVGYIHELRITEDLCTLLTKYFKKSNAASGWRIVLLAPVRIRRWIRDLPQYWNTFTEVRRDLKRWTEEGRGRQLG